ncbi:Electron transport complex protein RnfD [hydrothermal vent metagenome]|uniref:Electron transport complex protein RnfD n=1 Tax=hydrothermal vent metagenome TaxID=652676 RepID=A0A3B0YNW6_9ZZZZ
MEFPTRSSPYLPLPNNLSRLMLNVMLALIPGALALFWFFGWGIIFNLLITTSTALLAEAAVLKLRNKPVRPALLDGSAALTGLLLGLALPPLAPWWIPVIGALFAIVIAKQLYGGIGYNPFNPAMVGFVVLIISFPLQMTLWSPPGGIGQETLGFLDTFRLVFTEALPTGATLDSITMATPLDEAKTQIGLNLMWEEIRVDPRFGNYGGYGWEWINLAFLLGGLWLWKQRAIQWQIPVGMLGGLFVISLLFYIADTDTFGSPLFHLFSGATMLGAFFIATDPVSAATTPRGRLYFGAGIGVLMYVIRTWGGYPDGVAFGVLLMNMAAPAIDYYTKPRVFGQHEDADE